MSVETANFLSFWGNWILLAALIVGAIATGVVIVAGVVKDRGFEIYKLGVASQVSAATQAGIEAGKSAGGAMLEAGKANERAAGLEKEAANAKERTAQLEKEAAGLRLKLEKVRAPLVDRHLIPEQVDALVRALSGKRIASVLIAPSPDREINTFANELIAAFAKAGTPFNVTFIAGTMREGGINAVPDGLNVTGDDGPNKTAVELAFRDAEIPFGHEAVSRRFIEMPGAVYVTIGFRGGVRERE